MAWLLLDGDRDGRVYVCGEHLVSSKSLCVSRGRCHKHRWYTQRWSHVTPWGTWKGRNLPKTTSKQFLRPEVALNPLEVSLVTDTRGQAETGEQTSSHARHLHYSQEVAEIQPLRMPLRKRHRHQVKEREQFLSQWLPESSVKNRNGSRKTHRKCVLGFGVLQRDSVKHASAGKGRAVACRVGTPPGGHPTHRPRACLL